MNQQSSNLVLLTSIRTTCEHYSQSVGQKEIIEIGFGLVDKTTGQKYEPLSLFIKSKANISKYCSDLTGITQKDIEEGVSFDEALFYFLENYEPKQYSAWATYGNFTKDVLFNKLKSANSKWRPKASHINVQREFAVSVMKSEIAYGMKGALAHIGLKDIDNKSCEDEILNLGILYNEISKRRGLK